MIPGLASCNAGRHDSSLYDISHRLQLAQRGTMYNTSAFMVAQPKGLATQIVRRASPDRMYPVIHGGAVQSLAYFIH